MSDQARSSRPTYVFGHRNPDVDAICSAIAYADFKGRTEEGFFVPARCGNSNPRIDAVLNRFGLALPRFVGDVTPRLRDAMTRDPVTVGPDTTCARALELIDRHDVQVLPVTDGAGALEGSVSIFQLGQYFLPQVGEPRRMRRVETSIRSITDALKARVLHQVDPDRAEELYVRVGAMDIRSFDRFADRESIDPGQSVIVVGDRRDIQERSIELGVRLLVITGGLDAEDEVVRMAEEAGVSLAISPHDSATTAWTIRSASRVEGVMVRRHEPFRPEETVRDARRRTATMGPAVFLVTNDEGELEGIFTRRDLLRPPQQRIILVDHNELNQAVPGAGELEITEVVDHHRLGDLRTQNPILFINRPVGSTCTIVADLYRQRDIDPPPAIAGAMMGGLISDTLNMRSPTTTGLDHEILEWLSGIAGVTGDELADAMFSSGSVVRSLDPPDVLRQDRKVYEESGWSFSISQVEETGFDEFWERDDELLAALEALRKEEGLDFAGLLVTDVKGQDSLLAVRGARAFIDAITYPAVEEGEVYDLSGVVSRKKQLLPFITGLLQEM